ncbi:MAG: carbohydrate binding domain-containing protein, partial [Bacteroidales bacterium]|jgi:uncharacterized repeat protein (TIGR02543 family)|nr:carbohydrate binding domain-containing protein [Bacteroidales bacterium]
MTHASDANAQLAFNVGQSTQNVSIRNVQLRYAVSTGEYFTLTTNISPTNGGTVTKSPDAASYASGRQVELTAVAATGWEFAGWTGDASGNTTPLSVTMNSDKTVTAQFVPANIIKNGTFAGTTNWTIQNGNGSNATVSASGNTATINITAVGANSWEPQLVQKQVALTQGVRYILSFEASAAAARTMDVMLQMSASPYTTYASTSVNLATGMQLFEYEFDMTHASDANAQLAFNVGQSTQNVSIRNVQLRSTGSTPPVLPPNTYEIATWQDFKTAAVTFTFDDNCANQFSAAVPLFNGHGYKASFYPVINWNPNWSTLRTLAQNGHEIGSHSVTHPSAAMTANEMSDSKNRINTEIAGVDCNTVTYPNCVVPNKTTAAQYFIGGRVCNNQVENSTPADYYAIGSIICGNQGTCNSLANFQTQLTTAKNKNGWAVFLIHEINNGSGYSPLQSTVLGSTLDYIKQNDSDYWVTTFRNAILYSKERNAAVVREISATGSEIQLEITDNLNNGVYNYPLSLRCALPAGWENVAATQGVNEIDLRIANGYMYFNAVPDGGIISLRNQEAGIPYLKVTESGESSDKHIENIAVAENTVIIYPNPVKNELRIESGGLRIESIEIVNFAGKIQISVPFNNTIDVANLPSGIYMIKMYSNKGEIVQRFVKE